MNGKTGEHQGEVSGTTAKGERDARLKAALRANLQRRKAQTRGRAAEDAELGDMPAQGADRMTENE